MLKPVRPFREREERLLIRITNSVCGLDPRSCGHGGFAYLIPGKAVQDQIGWPRYVAEVAAVYRSIPAAERARTVLIASNYGEAGALHRYGPALGLPTPYSGHNALYALRRPPDSATTAVVIGGQLPDVRALFASCTIAGHLQDHAGVANEEQGKPIGICRGPRRPWHDLWPRFRHFG